MARVSVKVSTKAGKPPGTIVFIGKKRQETPGIKVIDYNQQRITEKEAKTPEECFSYMKKPTSTWINVTGVHDTSVIEKLGRFFGIHPLTMEDMVNTNQRPKMEDYDEYLFLVLRMISYENDNLETEQVSIALGKRFLISFQEREGDVFNSLRERIRKGGTKIRKMGNDFLAYSIMDSIVDSYFSSLEAIGERIESMEEVLMKSPGPDVLKEIHKLKRELIILRKSVWPLREVISSLQRTESSLMGKQMGMYLRDLYDHTIQVIDTIETYRDMVSGMLDIYLSSVSNRMNEVMKVLTIFASIFIPLTFVAGIYGMNFRYMPELEWEWGYPMVWLVITGMIITMLAYFRRKGWL